MEEDSDSDSTSTDSSSSESFGQPRTQQLLEQFNATFKVSKVDVNDAKDSSDSDPVSKRIGKVTNWLARSVLCANCRTPIPVIRRTQSAPVVSQSENV